MIEYGSYIPTALVGDLQPWMDYGFLEPVRDPVYIEYYHQFQGFKILDNGFIENGLKAMNHDQLLEFVKLVKPDMVVATDREGVAWHNLYSARVLNRLLQKNSSTSHIQVMVVLGGPNTSRLEWQSQAVDAAMEGFRAVAMPHSLNRVPIKFKGRVHLFGLRAPEEWLSFVAECDGPMSLDTVEPISAAYNQWEYSVKGFASFPRPQGYAGLSKADLNIHIAKSNIKYLKNKLHNPDRRF